MELYSEPQAIQKELEKTNVKIKFSRTDYDELRLNKKDKGNCAAKIILVMNVN